MASSAAKAWADRLGWRPRAVSSYQERELAKVAALAEALALALRQRGVDERLAALAARTGIATFAYAVASWFADPSGGLGTHLDRAFEELDGLASSLSPRPPTAPARPNGVVLD